MRLSSSLGLWIAVLAIAVPLLSAPASAAEVDQSGAEELGWKLAIQAWTNNRATLFETIELAERLDLHYVEAYPGQRLSPDFEGAMGPDMTEEQVEALLEKAEECDVEIPAFGVTGIPGDDEGARKLFEWAKRIGIETLTTEPGEDQIPTLDELAEEYEIGIAIHNHPKPSHYWDAATVLAAVGDASERVGACADTGHWVRSELDPVECLKQLEGRIISLHFKDLNARTGDMHDVPWGTGESDAAGQLAELKRQGFEGVFSMEYEHQWDEPTLAKCVEFFHAQANELADD